MVESYRYYDTVKHQTILHLGALEELPLPEQKKLLGRRIDELIKERVTRMPGIFRCEDAAVEKLAQKFVAEIIDKQKIDISGNKDYQVIDTQTVKNEDVQEVGGEWLCLQALEQLKLSELFRLNHWSEHQIQLALTHIISRAVYPASELATSRWIKQNSAVCELTGYNKGMVTKDKLYEISHKLYALKEQIENHLSTTTNELFDLNDTIMIYDLTNTYYEGKMAGSKMAHRGVSKEKRSDAKLIVLAMVINVEGFIKYSNMFEGNTTDNTTIVRIIAELAQRTSHMEKKPIVVMDAGISTNDNLRLLKKEGYDYMCVSRSGLTRYRVDPNSDPVKITDKQKQPITLQKVLLADNNDNYLRVYSQAKETKERSMNTLFKQRFEAGLVQTEASLHKKNGVKKAAKVYERIGRLKQKYPSIHKHYEITTTINTKEQITSLQWTVKSHPQNQGQYLLRTTLNEKDEKVQWFIYNTIREIEATFRALKTDLDLRPIYHKTDLASMAHLHLGLLAYSVVNTIRYQLKQKDIHHQWNEIVRIMNTQKIVTTKMKNSFDQTITVRKCSEPNDHVIPIYDALNYKHRPFIRKKVVVPPPNIKKNQNSHYQHFTSG